MARQEVGIDVESRKEEADCSIVKREKRRKHVRNTTGVGDESDDREDSAF